MLQKSTFCSLVFSSLLALGLHASDVRAKDLSQKTPPSCGNSPRPMRLTLRHIEGEGVGYNQGYTTLEGFFAPLMPWKDHWVPFLDLRGHVFNNGKFAANTGIGMRYLTDTRIWGANVYYDYRNTSHQHYNQISMGFESLGKIWDFRLNGYLPVGNTTSPSYGHAKFKAFKNHHMLITRKYDFAMKGANAEVGAHVNTFKKAPLYFATGPYYLEGQGKAAWGGEFRAAVDIFDYVRLEGNTSYDSIFRWIGQGQISVMISFGGKREIKQTKAGSCSRDLALSQRVLQPVDRNEIIAITKKHKTTKAINPATRQPYFFWFVNNTSHSAGTFESPFPTLVAAQNASSPQDIIYVFPGDGTSAGMNTGLVLKDNQKLFGAATPQTLTTTVGTVTIPPQATTMPIITGSISPVLSAANNNEISGIHFIVDGQPGFHGIEGINIANISIHNNVLDVIGHLNLSPNVSGISLNCRGTNLIEQNIFNVLASQFDKAVHIVGSKDPNTNYIISKNIFLSPNGQFTTGIELGDGPNSIPISDFNTLIISQNQFSNFGQGQGPGLIGGKAIGGFGFGGKGSLRITNNTFSKCGAGVPFGGKAVTLFRIQSGGNIVMDVRNNRWENSLNTTLSSFKVLNSDVSSKVCVNMANNVSDITSTFAYIFDNAILGTFNANADVSDVNIGTIQKINVTDGTCP